MPDLITHVTIAHILRRPFELVKQQKAVLPFRTLFLLGTILPDILTRPFYILFPIDQDWTVALHTPLGGWLSCTIIAFLFKPAIRKRAYINLLGGAGIHFLLDSLQKQIVGNNFWLFPFSYKNFSIGIMTAGELIPFIPLWIGLVIILELSIFLYRKKKH